MKLTRSGSQLVRLNPLSMNEELLVGLLAAAVIGGGGFYLYKRANPSITIAPGAQSVAAKQGATVTLKLPAGAMWTAVAEAGSGGAALAAASGNGSYAIPNVTPGSEIINATWKDSAGTTQNSTITVTAA